MGSASIKGRSPWAVTLVVLLLLCAGALTALAPSSGVAQTATTTTDSTTTGTPEPQPTTTEPDIVTTPTTPGVITDPVVAPPPGPAPPPAPVVPPLAPPPLAAQELRKDRGAGNAALQTDKKKLAESRGDCKRERPPINKMLAIGGVFPTDKGTSWTPLALLVAACFAVIGATAYYLRRRGRRKGRAPAPGSGLLETVSALVAVLGTLVAIADQFIEERPTREATITVRDVMPRITRSQFERQIDNKKWRTIDPVDRREVGNVVLLEIQLTGYRDRPLDLGWGTYSLDRDVSGTLLNATQKPSGKGKGKAKPKGKQDEDKPQPIPLPVEDDHQTSFVPVWLGYPKSSRFEVQFRLIEGQKIRQLVTMGPLRGSEYRYACGRDVNADARRPRT